MLLLSRRDVERLLDVDRLVDALALAMSELSAGRASMPARVAARVVARRAMLAAMPAFLPSAAALTTKLVSLFPENVDRPTHQAIICCFDPVHGTPLAIMDGTYVTAARTAAGSVLATRLLARRDAAEVCVIGTGVQARSHARAFSRVPGVERLRIAARDPQKIAALVDELTAGGLRAEASDTIERAVRSADIVCATTHTDRPVVLREWVRRGTHINSVGYNSAGEGEVDTATIRDALVAVESRAAALAPAPAGAVELRIALQRGALDERHVVEIGELVSATATGRTDPTQLTLYKSVGVAVQDAAAAAQVLAAARAQGIGVEVEL